MQVNTMSMVQATTSNSASSLSASISASTNTDFTNFMNNKISENKTNTSTSSSSSSKETEGSSKDTSSTDNDKTKDTSTDSTKEKTESTSKKDDKEVNEEAVAVPTEVVAEEVVDQLTMALMGAVEEMLDGGEEVVEQLVETGEIQVLDLNKAKLNIVDMVAQTQITEEVEVEVGMEAEVEDDILGKLLSLVGGEEVVLEQPVEMTQEVVEDVSESLESLMKNMGEEGEEKIDLPEDTTIKTEVVVEGEEVDTEMVAPTTLAEVAKEEEVVFIKVGDSKLNESWQQLMDDMGKEIIAKQQIGIDKFTVVLNPEGLGEVKIEVIQQESGLLVNLICNQSSTSSLISDNLLGLARILTTNLGDETEVIVTEDAQQNENQDLAEEESSNRGQENKKEKEVEEVEIDFRERMRLGLFDEE